MKKMKIFVSSLIAGTVTLAMISPAYAYIKDETVYTKLNPDGSKQVTIVSEHLKNDRDEKELEDLSTLKNILNVNGDETFTQNGNKITWHSDGNDIYYQGTTDQQLPITMKITYKFNGKDATVEEMLGKKGKVEIHIEYENHVKQDGLYVPFVVATGMMLPTDKNSKVSVTNGKVTSNGSNHIVIALAAPGLSDDFHSNDLESLNEVTIQYQTTDFELKSIMNVATPSLLSDLDMDIFDKMDEGYSLVDQLCHSYQQIETGSQQLKEGTHTFASKYSQFHDGVNTLNDKSQQLISGVNQINTGLKDLDDGLNQLNAGLQTLTKNSEQLRQGTKQLTDQILNTVNQQLKAANIQVTEENYSKVLTQAIQTYQEQLTKLEAVPEEQRPYIPDYDTTVATLKTVIPQLQGAKSTLDSVFTFKKGINDYTKGVDQVANGMPKVTNGSSQLLGGSKQLLTGVQTLIKGTDTLASNSSLLKDAANELSQGAKKLDDGIHEFDDKGLSQINSYINGTLKTNSKKAKQLINLANDYKTFTSVKDGVTTSTKFIMIVDSKSK